MKLKLMLALVFGLAGANAMACYTVYGSGNRVLYQGEDPPVDMSQPLHRALQRRFPGGQMVFDQGAACGPTVQARLTRPSGPLIRPSPDTVAMAAPNTAAMGAGPAPNTAVMGAGPAPRSTPVRGAPRRPPSTPMLTDLHTAQSMGLPYQVMSGNIVLVPAAAARRVDLPAVTVVPADESAAPVAASAYAGPPSTSVMGAGPAPSQSPRGETVITELHNPPVTVVQRGSNVSISRN